MNGDVSSWSWFWSIWSTFDKAGALANFLQIAGAATPIALAVLGWMLRKRGSKIALLQSEVDHKNKELLTFANRADDAERRSNKLQVVLANTRKRLAEATYEIAEERTAQGDERAAIREIKDWFEREGQPVSQLLLRYSAWALNCATGESRASRLSAAEGLAIASMAIFPQQSEEARRSMEQVEYFRRLEAQPTIPLYDAMAEFSQNDTMQTWDVGAVNNAHTARSEAHRLVDDGEFLKALSEINRSVELMSSQLGARSLPALQCRQTKAYVLLTSGATDAGLQEVCTVEADLAAVLEPDHPELLSTKSLHAWALQLKNDERALPLALEVLKSEEIHPELGPDHPLTLSTRHLLVGLLKEQPEKALGIAHAVSESTRSILGPEHRNTLASRVQLAELLHKAGQSELAIKTLESVINIQVGSTEFGDEHFHTQGSRSHLALILYETNRLSEALGVIEKVLLIQERNPEFGPQHSDTLNSIRLRDRIVAKAQAGSSISP